jgi:hypothetical protein
MQKAKNAKELLGDADSVEDSRLQCYCKQQYLEQGSLFLIGPYNTPEKTVCKQWSEIQKSGKLQYFLGISLVVIMNSVLWLVITIFDSLSKHRTLNTLTNSQSVEIMASQFVNTGILLLLVSLHTYGMFSSFGFLKGWLGNGPHDDFTTAWHTQNGSSLIITLGSTIACALIIPVISVWPTVPLFIWYFEKGAVTKTALDELYRLPQFAFSSRIAASNCILWAVMMYSGAMPILYLLGFFYFVASYWIDKWAFLRGSSQPPSYNQEVVFLSVSLWCVAPLLHVMMVCCMYTPTVFPSEWSWFKDFVFNVFSMTDVLYDDTMKIWDSSPGAVRGAIYGTWIRGRFTDIGRKCCWSQFFTFMVFSGFFFWSSAYHIVCKPFNCVAQLKENLVDRFCPCLHRKHAMATIQKYDEGLKIAKENNAVFSYKLSESKMYEDAYLALLYNPDEADIEAAKSVAVSKSVFGPKTKVAHRLNRAQLSSGLIVVITSATGLKKADSFGLSDPYCKCSVPGKPALTFKTHIVKNDLNPQWDYEHHLKSWSPGDSLKFEVQDHDSVGSEESLGFAELAYDKFQHQAFDGELDLIEAGEGITAKLKVMVEFIVPADEDTGIRAVV